MIRACKFVCGSTIENQQQSLARAVSHARREVFGWLRNGAVILEIAKEGETLAYLVQDEGLPFDPPKGCTVELLLYLPPFRTWPERVVLEVATKKGGTK